MIEFKSVISGVGPSKTKLKSPMIIEFDRWLAEQDGRYNSRDSKQFRLEIAVKNGKYY